MDSQKDEEIKHSQEEKTDNTPYDDVFRTLLIDTPQLVLPLLNEIFGENYTGEENVIVMQNEHFLNIQGDSQDKRVTDASFEVEGEVGKHYVFECQSTTDNTMLLRMFQYVMRVGREHGVIEDNILRVEIPKSAVLYLRSTKNTPAKMVMQIIAEGKSLEIDVAVLKLSDYDVSKIIERKCYFLLPFISFLHEGYFTLYNEDASKLEAYLHEQMEVLYLLKEYAETGTLKEYTAGILKDMLNKVNMSLLAKYGNVRKEVEKIMGGKVLEYPTKTLYREARAEGRAEGRAEEQLKFALIMLRNNLKLDEIISSTGFDKAKLMNLARENNIEYDFVV